jgi:undecaprenyl-phosphate 4-deoxy-4-formamido-L-arabinose transferase
MIDYSIIIPVYRGEGYITLLTKNIISFFSKTHLVYEIIFIADFPRDNSWQIIEQLKKKYPDKIIAALLKKNIGQHAATIEGLKIARGKYIFTIDEDGQHNPDDFEIMINQIKKSNDEIIYGIYKQRNHSIFRNYTSLFSKLIFKITINNFYWHYSSFRLIRFDLAQKIITTKISYPFIDGMVFLNTDKISTAIVNHNIDKTGRSSYSIIKLIVHFFKIIKSYGLKRIR